MIYLLTAIGLSPGGRSTLHIYTQTIHRATQFEQMDRRTDTETGVMNLTVAFRNFVNTPKILRRLPTF